CTEIQLEILPAISPNSSGNIAPIITSRSTTAAPTLNTFVILLFSLANTFTPFKILQQSYYKTYIFNLVKSVKCHLPLYFSMFKISFALFDSLMHLYLHHTTFSFGILLHHGVLHSMFL